MINSVIASANDIEEVIVTTDFYHTPALELGGSISVMKAFDIQQCNADHLEQFFNLPPNVNYASGASRGRFIQIRGIGERSQFIDLITSSQRVKIINLKITGCCTWNLRVKMNFSDSHDQKSQSYHLLNLRFKFQLQ